MMLDDPHSTGRELPPTVVDGAPADVLPARSGLTDAAAPLMQSLSDIHTAMQHGKTISAMFDGSRTVALGEVSAPVGVVLLGAALALFAFNKDR